MPEALASILEQFPRRISIEAAYLASMVLRYKLSIDEIPTSKVINKGITAQPRGEVRRAAISLLREIERSAGKDIVAFDERTVKRCLKELAEVVRRRSAEDLGYEVSQGKALLKELRAEQHEEII